MGIQEYAYYFRKPRSEIVKDVLSWLLIGGMIAIAATSPYFVKNILEHSQKLQKYKKKKIVNTFYRLRKEGVIHIEERNHQIFISLTPEGERKAGMFQLNKLGITRSKRWDGTWWVLLFDIPHKKRFIREALRGKLRELGFVQLQKSVWVHAFPCRAEVELLKKFFGLSSQEIRLIVAKDIGETQHLERRFQLSR